MAVAVMKTRAEQALADQFDAFAGDLPGPEEARRARQAAIAVFKARGLPHRRIEDWKYTDVRARLDVAFPPVGDRAHGLDRAMVDWALGSFANLDAYRLVLVDGWYAADLSALAGLGEETAPVEVTTVGQGAFADHPARSALAASNALAPLHDAFVTDGARVRVPELRTTPALPEGSGRPLKPLLIAHIHTAREPGRTGTRSVIDVGQGRALTIVEVYCRIGDAPLQALASTTVWAGADTTIDHIKVVRAGAGHTHHFGHTDVVLNARATYRGFQLTMGEVFARNDVTVTFNQPDAKIDLAGLMLGRGSDHIDTTLVVEHRDTGSVSRELYKAVLEDTARAVFQGKVVVLPAAQKTDGKMMAQALMLSPTAEFDSKPELEIYADDVVCGHGSTVAELDPDHLFYLSSRGIPATEARALLIHAFIREPIDKVVDDGVRAALEAEAASWLGTRAVTDDAVAIEE